MYATVHTSARSLGLVEDDLSQGEKEVQKLTDDYVKKIDNHLTAKEAEITTV